MPVLGYTLSSEEFGPTELVRHAIAAEKAGFEFAMISDHYHPWSRRQGNSPFVWPVIGAIAQATENMKIGTGVTCPTIRMHPAIVAQAAATAALLLPGRFMLGLGTGENLNEHIVGAKWPPGGARLEMLDEALDVIRNLWNGGLFSHRGKYFTVEEAQVFSLPEQPPPIMLAAAKKGAAALAARRAEGFISTAPNKSLVDAFKDHGGEGKPVFGQVTISWASSEEEGKRIAREIWPNALVSGEVSTELRLPRQFEQVTEDMSQEMITTSGGITCGPDTQKHLDAVRKYAEAGFDHIYIHQIGPNQRDFIRFAQSELLPELRPFTSA
jgi:coenzyme F420-dependent glucose-6-phosphate dehydrogenase